MVSYVCSSRYNWLVLLYESPFVRKYSKMALRASLLCLYIIWLLFSQANCANCSSDVRQPRSDQDNKKLADFQGFADYTLIITALQDTG